MLQSRKKSEDYCQPEANELRGKYEPTQGNKPREQKLCWVVHNSQETTQAMSISKWNQSNPCINIE